MTEIFRAAMVLAYMLLAACVSIPESIRNATPGPPVDGVLQAPQQHFGQQVRWGGTVAGITHRESVTELEIVSRELTRNGQPRESKTRGRFIARVEGFLEPTEYEDGVEVTVVGVVKDTQTRNIGDYPYVFPVVTATAVHKWESLPEYSNPQYWPYPWWYRHYQYSPHYLWPHRPWPYNHRFYY